MTKRFAAMLFGLLMSGAAQAADLPASTYKAPPAVSPATNWTGFYVGAMGGYATDASSGGGFDLKGGFVGGTIGFNWQTGALVLGIEGDGAWSNIKATAAVPPIISIEDRIRALGSVRGRVGVAIDNVLLYGTAGVTAAENRLSFTFLGVPFSDSKTHVGWTAGAGVEWMFARNWSLKVEYLYRDFGSENYFATIVPGGIASGNARLHSGQVGINFHF